MAEITKAPKLSIVLPTLNEAKSLPLLLTDLFQYDEYIEIIVVDGGSSDLTVEIATLAGAKTIKSSEANRGLQLQEGAYASKGEWILFIHADSRMSTNWQEVISKKLDNPDTKNHVWFFNFKVKRTGICFRIMEIIVAIRSNIFKRPYGDQGLLISKRLYTQLGGYKPIPLMEDLDFVIRISRKAKLKNLGISIFTNGRRWEKTNILVNAFKNISFKYRWMKGTNARKLAEEYYLITNKNKS